MPREERKYVDPKELRSEGFLQEVNRLFFHPLGLALSIARWEESDIQKLIDGARLMLFKSGSPIQPLEVIRRNDPER